MKTMTWVLIASAVISFVSCQKSNDTSQISLTPSSSQVTVGETVSVALSANTNASSWTVTPASTATKAYAITTSKVNYFSFKTAGVYTVSVRARNIAYDSTHHQSLDSCWNHGNGAKGACTKGVDTASVAITVTGK